MTRVMAAHYGQSPDHFDGWPFVEVVREWQIFQEIRGRGEYPLTTAHFFEALGQIFGRK